MGVDMITIPASSAGQPDSEADSSLAQRPASYFRFGWSGMALACDVLAQFDALDWETQPWADLERASTDDELDAALAMRPPSGRAGGWKFGTNDGWIVTPPECRVIAAALDRVDPDVVVGALIAERERYAALNVRLATRSDERDAEGPFEPDPEEVRSWLATLAEFAAFCRRSADDGAGFRVV